MNISKSIDVCLAKNKWSQKELAEVSGLTQASISAIRARGTCNTKALKKLADAFGLKVSAFIKKGEKDEEDARD